jgi:hypothetical protein
LEGKSFSILIGSSRMKRPCIGGKDFFNFHWTKKISSRKGREKLGKRKVQQVFFRCDFSWEREEKEDEFWKMVEREKVDWRLVVLRKSRSE